jgi:hypothetical protein
MKTSRLLLVVLALGMSSSFAVAQTHDALTEKEADALRETAQEPNRRLHLLVTYAKARMEAIEHLRSDQNMAAVQADQVSTLLDDVASIIDEIDENLADYDKKGEDIRKALREVIEADTDFQLKLRAIKDTAPEGVKKQNSFGVENALESVNSSADAARAMLDDENAKKGKEKIEKPEKDKEDKSAKKDKPAKEPKQRPDYTGMGGIGKEPPK